MNVWDIIIITLIGVATWVALRAARKNKGCSCKGCSSCGQQGCAAKKRR